MQFTEVVGKTQEVGSSLSEFLQLRQRQRLPLRRRCNKNRPGSALWNNEPLRSAAGAVEFGQIGLHPLVGAQRSQNSVEDGCGGGIGGRADAVVHPLAFAARGNDAGLAQVGQVARDLGLALAENLDKMADADLAAGHQVQQAQAGGVGQGRE